jgi:hypothetical protein
VYIAVVTLGAALLVTKVDFPKLPGRRGRNGKKEAAAFDVHIAGE